VSDRVAAEFPRNAHQVPNDDRAGKRGDQGVAFLVSGVGFQRGHDEVVRELIFGVDHDRFDRTTVECALPDRVHVFAALTQVDREGDNLFAGLVTQPANSYRGVKTSGIGEDNAF